MIVVICTRNLIIQQGCKTQQWTQLKLLITFLLVY